MLGKPFVSGGRGPDNYDCWGCAIAVYKRYGIELPDYPMSIYTAIEIANKINNEKQNEFWHEIKEPITPCLIVMKMSCEAWANHIAVYIGNGQFIHAYRRSGVVIDKIKNWKNYIVGYYTTGGRHDAGNSEN